MSTTSYKISLLATVLTMVSACSFNSKLVRSEPSQADQLQAISGQAGADAAELCVPEAGSPFHLRKVLLVAGTIGIPDHARDLPGLAGLTSRRLQSHLDQLDRFHVRATHDSSFASMATGTAARVRELGRNYDSQFVVKLEIEDLTVHRGGIWLPEFLGGRAKRNMLLKLYIFDTEYGALFHTEEFQRTVTGDVTGHPGSGSGVSLPWFKTDLGRQMDKMLKRMSKQINEKLACVPFSTRIDVVKGSDIHLKAGYLQGIRPGDTLRVYRRRDRLVPASSSGSADEQLWIMVNTVYPNYSIASFAEQSITAYNQLDTGDFVRAW